MVALDAVVVNYQTPADLQAFLESWDEHAPEWCRLTVVNVDPQDEDDAVADAVKHRHIKHAENVGYAYACNTAIDSGEAEVLAFFNADTRLLADVIEPLYMNLISRDDWGIIGPRQVDDSGRLTHAGIMGTGAKPQLRAWMQRDSTNYTDVRDDAVSVMGSAYFVKRECWEQLRDCGIFQKQHPDTPGAFLPTKHYYEETWCSYHARAHGWKVVYYGPAKMIHRWHKASPIGGHADKLFSESQVLFREMCDLHGIERD